MAKCKVCLASYDGHVTKICAACMAPVEVCLPCYDALDKVVCPECVRDAVLNGSVDALAEALDKRNNRKYNRYPTMDVEGEDYYNGFREIDGETGKPKF
jgi:hypothetical protein